MVAAASAVADSLPFDKQTTKSELLRQLQQHEEKSRAQKDREKHGIRSVGQKGNSVVWGPFPSAGEWRTFVLHVRSLHGPRTWHRRKGAHCQALKTEGEN